MSKMSAKLKKRLLKLENKTLKLEKLELKDVICSICQSILTEPVTLPCNHYFCQRCFNGSIENNALCCPLCRLRIGSWLRSATKQNNLVNVELWNYIKTKFPKEIDNKLKGRDIILPEEIPPPPRLSAPGEIRYEYELELKRLREQRLQQEQKQLQKTELFIKKIQQEELEAQQKHIERLKQDELLAQQLVQQEQPMRASTTSRKQIQKPTKTRLKTNRIDSYLSRIPPAHIATTVKESPLLTDDTTSTEDSSPKTFVRANTLASPELVPSYGKLIKNFIDNKIKDSSGLWNKENGEKEKEKLNEKEKAAQPSHNEIIEKSDEKFKLNSGVIKSLLVSLPLPPSGILQHKVNKNKSLEMCNSKQKVEMIKISDNNCGVDKKEELHNVGTNRNLDTGSADSMREELCYFKPIERISTTSKAHKNSVLRVPGVRAEARPQLPCEAPSRAQYIEGLCRLRNLSLSKNLPSAFVIALTILKAKEENRAKLETNPRTATKRPCNTQALKTPSKKAPYKTRQTSQMASVTKNEPESNLRRTRSMSSIIKDENETTPKKAKILERKVVSERKPRLRSDSKKLVSKKRPNSALVSKSINKDKVDLVVKNLSSPIENCDVKKIVEEQVRIEQMIIQEKSDLELARKMDAEWNGRRHLRRAPGKRQVTLNYALRPPKKVKV